MKHLVAFAPLALLVACSHPLEVDGEGDILSASGSRDCLLEQFQASAPNCTQNYVIGLYDETYYAQPRPGWQFERWENYCEEQAGNACSFSIPTGLVVQSWGETVPPLRAVFSEQGSGSFQYEVHLYKETTVDDGVADFFTDYTYTATCNVEIEPSSGAVTPNAFFSVMATAFRRIECSVPGNDGVYDFSFGADVAVADFWRGSFNYPQTDFGLLFDSAGQPLRFDSPQVSFDAGRGFGWFDSPEPGFFGSGPHSFMGFQVDDSLQTPLAVLLAPTQIASAVSPRGFVTASDNLPQGASAALLHGRFDFYEQRLRDGVGTVIDEPLRYLGFYTFDVIDSDEDGVADSEDNCPAAVNPAQADGNGDGVGDACD
ncbi:MAG: hypothetical protein NXI15_02815 [Gammaproteobacteria bacterium]|nr:hypothetical protein [Gammaproteobacteria bacterium]